MARTGSDDCASAYEPDGASVISFAQERIWFVEQLIPGTPAYVVPVVYRVPVALDAQVFERACREIIRRHEVLRTGFDEDHDGRPRQRVAPTVDFTVRLFDLSDRSPLEREAEALRLATDEIRGPFDLRRPPLFRAMIVQVGEAGTIVVLTLHHIVADAWAVGVLTQELSEAYEAFADERPPKLPEVALQYSEFGRRQRDRLTDERLGDQLEYWRKTLEDAPGILDLPLDRTRPRKQTLCGAKEEIRLDAVLTASIESFARSCRATPFMVILSAFAALLHRYTDQTDIVVGTAVANRMSVDAERLIGFFANTLALRLNLSARPTFTDLVARTRETTLSAYANQDLPFERLVEELQPERDTSRTPLFQVWLVLQNAPLPPLRLGGTEGTPVELDNGTSKFDLSISLGVVGEELVGWVEYATDLFDRPTIARLVDHFEVFLAAAIEFPGRPIGALPLITRGEREALARDAAASRRDYPAKTVHELVADQVDRSPEAVAVVDEVTQMTYRELHERALTVAAMLASEGVVADEPVGLYLERSADAVAGLYGILLAGAAYLPLDPTYPRDRVAHMLNDSGARVVVTSTQARVPAGTSAKAVYVDGPRAAELEFTPRAVSPDSLGYVIYTSGSTGRPKGISLSHRSLTNLARWYGESLEPGAKTLQFSSLSFDASFHEIFFTLMSGGCVEICPEAAKRDPAVLLEVLRGRRIEKAILPAAAIEQVAEACEHDSRTVPLRELVSNAEQIQVTEAVRRLPQSMPRCAFYNHYGPSETHVVTAYGFGDEPESWPHHPPIGRPISNTQVYVLNAELEPAPVSIVGEIFIGGVMLARGYLNRPGLTADRFIPDPFAEEPGARMYRTGDLGRRLGDGNFEFLGRRDHQVKIRGFRVELGEIEFVLGEHPLVEQAIVRTELHQGSNRLVAFVRNASAAVAPAELRTFLEERLPAYMVPSLFVVVDDFPKTPSGKIDRASLRAPEAQRVEVLAEEPATPVECVLAALWADLLGVDSVGADDDFFDLGGHSLLAIQLVNRIRTLLETPLGVAAVFDHPTVARLATYLEGVGTDHLVRRAALIEQLESLTLDDLRARASGD